MTGQPQGIATLIMAMLALPLLTATCVTAQSISPIPKLDTNAYMTVWYEQAHLPNKHEKKCASDGMALYALADKALHYQLVTSCVLKDGTAEAHDFNGKLSKNGDGRLTITHFWFFSLQRWVIALGPQSDQALLGSSNRKSLWILTKNESIDPAALDKIMSEASAMGFDTAKLIPMPQRRSSETSEQANGPHSN